MKKIFAIKNLLIFSIIGLLMKSTNSHNLPTQSSCCIPSAMMSPCCMQNNNVAQPNNVTIPQAPAVHEPESNMDKFKSYSYKNVSQFVKPKSKGSLSQNYVSLKFLIIKGTL